MYGIKVWWLKKILEINEHTMMIVRYTIKVVRKSQMGWKKGSICQGSLKKNTGRDRKLLMENQCRAVAFLSIL